MSLRAKFVIYSLFSTFLSFTVILLSVYAYLKYQNDLMAQRFYTRVVNAFYDTKKIIKAENLSLNEIELISEHISRILETEKVYILKKEYAFKHRLNWKFSVGNFAVIGNISEDLLGKILKIDPYGVIGSVYSPGLVARYPLGKYGYVVFVKEIKHDPYVMGLMLFFPFGVVATFFLPVYRLISGLLKEVEFLSDITMAFSRNEFSKIELLRKDLRLSEDKDNEIYNLKVAILRMIESLEKLLLQTTKEKRFYENLALTDALTGLYNRRVFMEIAEKELSRAMRLGQPFSILMLDLDNFKRINDTYGHDVGDIVLRHVAQILKRNLRRMDVIARWGGEEFIVMLPNTTLENAYKVGEKLRKAVEAAPVELENGKKLKITVSVGVSSFRNQKSLEDIIREADIALYNAKKKGKNRVEIYKRGMEI
ncbi:GGDEF domain-containing protein [Aquifex pyrophilus]